MHILFIIVNSDGDITLYLTDYEEYKKYLDCHEEFAGLVGTSPEMELKIGELISSLKDLEPLEGGPITVKGTMNVVLAGWF